MLSQSVQDYLKTIYKFKDNGPVSTTEISRELNISGPSVTGMLKRLTSMGLVNYNSYKGVTLTDYGEKVALEVIRHHRILELFLKEKIGFPLEKVHDEACRLEHHISEEFLDRITEILGNPKYDPHGHPIPTKDGILSLSKEIPLSEADVDKELNVLRLSDDDEKLLNFLESLKILPNTKLKVIEKSSFNDTIKIYFNGNEKVLGYQVARNIFVDYVK